MSKSKIVSTLIIPRPEISSYLSFGELINIALSNRELYNDIFCHSNISLDNIIIDSIEDYYKLSKIRNRQNNKFIIKNIIVNIEINQDMLKNILSKINVHFVESLQLIHTNIDNNELQYVSQLKNLQSLSIVYGSIDNDSHMYLTQLPKLKSLSLQSCGQDLYHTKHSFINNDYVDYLDVLSNLESLDLSWNKSIDYNVLKKINKLSKLKRVDLRFTNVTMPSVLSFRQQLIDAGRELIVIVRDSDDI